MDFRRKKIIKREIGGLAELYPHDLQFYKVPPIGNLSLSEFEQLAMDRLKVLRILEQISLNGQAKSGDEWRNAVKEELKKQDLKTFVKIVTGTGCGQSDADYAARRVDHISHFILRLAYCRSEDLRRWFISKEVELFRLRWTFLTSEGKNTFMKLNNLKYNPISEREQQKIVEQSGGMLTAGMDYYRVHFTEVIDLVRTRRVYMKSGYAYITGSDIISVLVSLFRSHLSYELTRTSKHLPSIEHDERISHSLNGLHYAYTGKDFSTSDNNARVPIESLDALAQLSFPLCMRQLHATLKMEHHLKHSGRQQYSLFLKGIGVTLEDALTFWRQEFLKKMELETYEKKNYAYNIRHNYGKEGKKVNYDPHSCMKIITSSVAPGDQHGCPFKHYNLAALRISLQKSNLPPAGIHEICDYVTKGHYQLACAKHFEILHGQPPMNGINHPNHYFEQSQKIVNDKFSQSQENGKHRTVTPKAEPKVENLDDLWDNDNFELLDVDMGQS